MLYLFQSHVFYIFYTKLKLQNLFIQTFLINGKCPQNCRSCKTENAEFNNTGKYRKKCFRELQYTNLSL